MVNVLVNATNGMDRTRCLGPGPKPLNYVFGYSICIVAREEEKAILPNECPGHVNGV